ncbi:oxysterol-binding protein-related protein 8-like [Limulus polyphemus]|uniref:Oxysterol-binding protein n=1 Tax=Limulus polyphemus TaxID=6850 RepID=A0ABM1T6D1_LIMPO|nr:oxysterol-binding protein-related protein 8-like [Limulus polyphemus]
MQGITIVNKQESYKAQRKNYRREKKRVAKELLSTLRDPSIVILADWLKVRGTLKGWTKLWCVLKPGLLLLYKSPKTHKSSQWVGTVMLNACELIQRPSKKDGFCFKLYHPLEYSIWGSRQTCSSTNKHSGFKSGYCFAKIEAKKELKEKYHKLKKIKVLNDEEMQFLLHVSFSYNKSGSLSAESAVDEADASIAMPLMESVYKTRWPPIEPALLDSVLWNNLEDDVHTDENREGIDTHSVHSTESDSDINPVEENPDREPIETVYVENGNEEFGTVGDAGQTEEVEDENKSLIWSLVKQSSAVQDDDPFTRMKTVIQWYLSGFYKKPKGLKKPYNPILGETFRCCWKNTERDSRTFYIAEQVSHHPPVSAFYVTNRKDGFCISGSILAKSKFYGNSLSAILDGTACLTLLTRGEDYLITMPYAHCKGILVGTLTMELGGKVTITCEKTGYQTELEFKLRPFLGGPELCNLVSGKIKLGKETLATIEGHWDAVIYFKDNRIEEEHILWNPTPEVRARRLTRYTVPLELQDNYESERLWHKVSEAIAQGDQMAATEEKTVLEKAQRQAAKEKQIKMEKWCPRNFFKDVITGEWIYKYADLRPWDLRNDVVQYEQDFIIQTKTRHKTPVDIDNPSKGEKLSVEHLLSVHNSARLMQKGSHHRRRLTSRGTESSSLDGEVVQGSDSTESDVAPLDSVQRAFKSTITLAMLQESLEPIKHLQKGSNQTLQAIQRDLEIVMAQYCRIQQQLAQRSDLTIVASVLLIQLVIHCFLRWIS